MKKAIIILAVIITNFSYGQSYDEVNNATELCLLVQGNSFINDKDADIALDKILSVIGASKRFIMQPCSDINNAVATSYKGLRYILYDKEFMNTIAENTTAWSELFILAHEVGHHINGHSVDLLLTVTKVVEPKTLEAKRQQELESDEFAGFILGKLGATLEQTSEAVNLLASNKDDIYSTHPNKVKRLNAIKVGYEKALGNKPIVYDKPTNLQTADEYFYRANEKQAMKDYYGAIEDYTKAINNNPNFVNAYYNRGISKGKLEDKEGAIEDYTKAITIEPNDVSAYNNRGNLKRKLGDYYGSIADFTKAIVINPNYALAYYSRGVSKDILEDHYGAIADFTKAIELDPNGAHNYYGRGLSKFNLKDNYGAISDYTKAIDIDSNYDDAYHNRGVVKVKLKDYYGAIADYTKALDINPKYVSAYYNRGISKYFLGDKKGACQDGKKAQQLGYDASQLINASCN